MNWFSKNRRAVTRLTAKQEENQAAYSQIKGAMFPRLVYLAKASYPQLSSDDSTFVAALAGNLMTAEPENIKHVSASKTVIDAANQLALSALTTSSELREMAVNASHQLTFLFLYQAWEPETRTVDNALMEQAERCIENAIRWGEKKAIFLSTAVQLNMTWRRYGRALELAAQAVDAEPSNAEAIRMKGMATYANGDLLAAKVLLERARELWPGIQGVDEPLAMIEREQLGS